MILNYSINSLADSLNSKNKVTILRGAGTLGKLAIIALNKIGIKVDYFWDMDPKKKGLKYDWSTYW